MEYIKTRKQRQWKDIGPDHAHTRFHRFHAHTRFPFSDWQEATGGFDQGVIQSDFHSGRITSAM